MIIGVDAGSLSVTDERLKVGVFRVAYNLIKELSKIDTSNEYRLYSFQLIEKGVVQEFGANTKNVVITPSVGWSSIRLPLELKLHPVDVFLGISQQLPDSTSHNIDCDDISRKSLTILPPLLRRLNSHRKMALIGFIYDLAFLYAPDAYGSSFHQLKKQTDALVNRANQIITISESSKSDILSHYKSAPERVSVCYPGVSDLGRTHLSKKGESFKNKHPYFLFVGSLNKAKDLPLAIESFALFLKKINKPYDLLLIGGDYWPDPRIDESINRFKLKERVKKIGFVADEALPLYYRGATAFFTTPVREGFCLPAVESMACGTPVVAIDRGAMKEVIGKGGLIVKPEKGSIADALYTVVTKKELHKKLSHGALVRAKNFSWKSFAGCVYDSITH